MTPENNKALDALLINLFGKTVGPVSDDIRVRVLLDQASADSADELEHKMRFFGIGAEVGPAPGGWSVTAPFREMHGAAVKEHEASNPSGGIAGRLNTAFYKTDPQMRVLVPLPKNLPMEPGDAAWLLRHEFGFLSPLKINHSSDPAMLEVTREQFQTLRNHWQGIAQGDDGLARLTQRMDELRPKDGAFGTPQKAQKPGELGTYEILDYATRVAAKLGLTGEEAEKVIFGGDSGEKGPEDPADKETPPTSDGTPATRIEGMDAPNIIRLEFGKARPGPKAGK